MPKRADLKKILVLGSGGIVIGQACEFDYSGTQAIQALKQEGYQVVLVNSNPATIMTDPELADRTYIEPLTVQILEKVVEKERPCAILPTVGGQTALNLAIDLAKAGVLEKYGVELLGADIEAIDLAEDRHRFRAAMLKAGLDVPASTTVETVEAAVAYANEIGYPLIIRPSFTLGGSGGGFAANEDELRKVAGNGLLQSPVNQVLVEQSIAGWKEYELEVVRDKADNFIVVCSIENVDPMGVHTGDSITVAPAQTLTDPRIPEHARLGPPDRAQRGRGNRRLQCPVRCQSSGWTSGGDRDEPTGQSLLGAGLQGHRLSRLPKWPPTWPSATPWTSCPTKSPEPLLAALSPPSITWWSRSPAGTLPSFPEPTTLSGPR